MGLTKYLHLTLAAALVATLLSISSCSKSGGGGVGSGTMYVETCSLGCSNGQNGLQVSCASSQIFQNQELGVLFSQPVNISSVNSTTFQIINPDNSDVPSGSFFLDPSNPRRVIFRPALTLNQTTGQPEFGLDPLTTYLVTVPGVLQGDSPPYVMSASGRPNQSRLQCTISTTNQTVDLVPGPPQVDLFVDIADGMGGIIPNQPAENATDVALGSTITMVFNDVMNSSTLVNSANGTSDFIRVEIDPDGLTFNPADRFQLPGLFTIVVDEVLLRTTVTFTPSSGFPSAGAGASPRKVVITLPSAIQDLSGNSLFNAGEFVFTPEVVIFPPVALPDADGENFTDTANEDGSRSSADWGNGRVRLRFTSGGSGRLGDLRVLTNQTVILDTDSQVFPLPDSLPGNFTGQQNDIMSNEVPGVDYDPTDSMTWPTVTVTDGVFEFASLRIAGGGRVICRGSNPARIVVRGEAFIGGVLDVSGGSPGPHNSSMQYGQAGGAGGPNAGGGGGGGVRFDHETTLLAGVGGNANNFQDLVCVGALGHPTCTGCTGAGLCTISDFIGVFTPALMDGAPGEGVEGETAGTMGGAPGGIHWPPLYPTGKNLGSAAILRDLDFNRIFPQLIGLDPVTGAEVLIPSCISLKVGGGGGGGVYGRSSGPSEPHTLFTRLGIISGTLMPLPDPAAEQLLDEDQGAGTNEDSNVPPATPPGDQVAIGLDLITRRLSPTLGHLRGGAGGGGAGGSLYGTPSPSNGVPSMTNPFPCKSGFLARYRDHSGAGGGGGGGALELHSGTRITIGGSVDASGGDGGSAMAVNDVGRSSAAPGGGGSGGAVLLQAPFIDVALGGNINVSGGTGGLGVAGSIGGHGGAGLVSLEDKTGTLDPLVEALHVLPFDSSIPDSNDILSLGDLAAPRLRPESITASVSCWMRPTGSFVTLLFAEDDTSDPDPANHTFGWNMMLQIDTTPGVGTSIQLEPYRGPNGILADSYENAFGNMLNHGLPDQSGSPVAVRFQGARLKNPGANLCDLDINGPDADIIAGSLTPWVNHPAELNDFFPVPEMIRFTVLFDRNVDPATLDMVKGATDLIILAQPD